MAEFKSVATRSGEVVGKVEDVTNFITSLDPDETFLTNKFGRTTVTNTKHEWLNDNLRPARDNAQVEVRDFGAEKARPRTRSANYVQNFENGYSVSDTTQAIKKYGVRDELSYQFVKCGKETARDLEYAIVNNAEAKPESSGVPARFGGVAYFLSQTKPVTSVSTAGVFTVTGHELFDGDPVILSGTLDKNFKANTPYYAHVLTGDTFELHATPQQTMMDETARAKTVIKPSTSVGASTMYVTNQNVIDAGAYTADAGKLTFDKINDLLQCVWKRGGSVDSIVCSGKNKRAISGMTQGVTKTRPMADKELVEVVDVLETDFGRVDVNAHRMYTDDVVDFFEYQYWKLGYLIPFHTENPPRTGSYRQKVITGAATLECTAPIASGRIKGITG